MTFSRYSVNNSTGGSEDNAALDGTLFTSVRSKTTSPISFQLKCVLTKALNYSEENQVIFNSIIGPGFLNINHTCSSEFESSEHCLSTVFSHTGI